MISRDTRAQILIVENGKYILLKHLDKRQNISFWALPGGGRELGETDEEAAVREAFEETGLKIKILPIKFESTPLIKPSMYKRLVTFLAYPIEGVASKGYDPEDELVNLYEIMDLKWQDLNDDIGIDEITIRDITPIREQIKTYALNNEEITIIQKTINSK